MMRSLLITGFAATLLLASATVRPQSGPEDAYPRRAVTLVVPFGPGGPVDTLARALGEDLSRRWLQPVIVSNRPGAAGIVAAQTVLAAPADGYTILVSSEGSLLNPPLTGRVLPYEPLRDFTPVTQLVTFNMALVVPDSLPVSSLVEFVAHAKRKPGQLAIGVSGPGEPQHMAYLDLARAAGVDLNVVPYSSGLSAIMKDLLGGQLSATIGAISFVAAHAATGRVKVLAAGGPDRAKSLPGVPTFAELGYADVRASFFAGLVVPSKTPQALVTRIAADVREVMTAPGFAARHLDPYSIDLSVGGPRAFAEFLRAEQQRLARSLGPADPQAPKAGGDSKRTPVSN